MRTSAPIGSPKVLSASTTSSTIRTSMDVEVWITRCSHSVPSPALAFTSNSTSKTCAKRWRAAIHANGATRRSRKVFLLAVPVLGQNAPVLTCWTQPVFDRSATMTRRGVRGRAACAREVTRRAGRRRMRAESRCSRVGGRAIHRARYYNPYLCRFLSQDPSGFAGGLNWFAFANGNPVSYLDPFGLGAVGENVNTSWINPSLNIPGMYQQVSSEAAAQNADTFGNTLDLAANFLQGVNQDLTPMPNATGAVVPFSMVGGGAFNAIEEIEGGLAGSIRNVNVTGGTVNCVNCAIAGDATLAGNAASALPGSESYISVLENTYGGSFQPISGQMQIGSILSQSGNGSRGVVFGESLISGEPGHVFNALNNNGSIQFIDFQSGGSGLNNFNNFQNFRFLLTHPGTP